MNEACAYVDGLNLRHAIAELDDPALTWCDIRKLLDICLPSHYRVRAVKYYTSKPAHIPEAVRDHEAYAAALERTGVPP